MLIYLYLDTFITIFAKPRGGRWFMQCPSLDGGSGWYTDTTGDHSGPGTLVFLISAEKKEYFWEYPKSLNEIC